MQYIPTKSTPNFIEYDLQAPQDASVTPHSRKATPLSFGISIPPELYGRIVSRSGMSLKKNINVASGVIEPDYRGEIKVMLINSSQKKYIIRKGYAISKNNI